MKKIRTNVNNINYPVGENIQDNLPIIKNLCEAIKIEYGNKRINLICAGSSGAIIASIIAMDIPKSVICHIKKEGEKSHCNSIISSVYDRTSVNIIVDDFISTGATLNRIFNRLTESKPTNKRLPVVIDCVCISGGYIDLDFEPLCVICS